MKIIEREHYLERLKGLCQTPDIKVITGIRRCGKSQLLSDYMEYLRKHDTKANIIYIDFTNITNDNLKEYHALNEYVESMYKKKGNNYLFIDEVQMCPNFELALNSLHGTKKYDIYITGSNAFLLSSDLATLFTGRTISMMVYPFSFKEYCEYYKKEGHQQLFVKYLQEGGMAGSYVFSNERDKKDYLREIFQTLVLRDVVQKYKIRNVHVLNRLVEFLCDNIGNLVSVNSIVKCLETARCFITNKTISAYLSYLCKAFAFVKVTRYDIKGKKYLNTSEKYYLMDHGIKLAVLGTKNRDYGYVMENIVALELMRRGYEIYVGVLYRSEIDFVAVKNGERIYIQVAAHIDNPETFQREVRPLLKIRDNYPKMVLARTMQPAYDYEGVQVMDIVDWLASPPHP